MEKTREHLEIASRLAEFGDATTISKVEQIVKRVDGKRLPSEEGRKEFLKMMGLYFYQLDILGGGEAAKKRFKDFMTNWLGIKCFKGAEPTWGNAELNRFELDELSYVLGWAARVAKERGSRVGIRKG